MLCSVLSRGRLPLSPAKSLIPAICKSQRPWPLWVFAVLPAGRVISSRQNFIISWRDVYGFALAHDPGVNTFGRYMLLKHDLDGNPVAHDAKRQSLLSSIPWAASMSWRSAQSTAAPVSR